MIKVVLLFSLLCYWSEPALPILHSEGTDLVNTHSLLSTNNDPTIITSDISTCEGGSANLKATVNGGITPFTYTWSGPNGFSSSVANPIITNLDIADFGTYNIIVTDATGATATTAIEVTMTDGCNKYIKVNGAKTTARYTIDFDTDIPDFNFISDQLVEVTGNVLLNNGTGADAGFDYTIRLSLEGGPDGSSVIEFPTGSLTAASRFQQSVTKIGESGGRTALLFAIEGRDGETPITYMRDPSTNMIFHLELDNTVAFKNITYELGDMDYNFISSAPSNTCFLEGESNNYRCRYSYIDRITFLSNVIENEYSFDDQSVIHQVNMSQFYSQFTDSNGDERPDEVNDGRIPGFSPDGNIKVCNQTITNEIKFAYDDPGFGLEGDADGYHDFDAKNQVMAFLSGMTFDLASECPNVHYMLCDEDAVLSADTTFTDITWYNSKEEEMGSGIELRIDSTDVPSIDSFYYVGNNQYGCEERFCCYLTVRRCCLKIDIGDQDQSIDLESTPEPLTVDIVRMDGDTLTYQWQSNIKGCNETFLDIPGATSPTYLPDSISATTYYRVVVSSLTGNIATCQVYSNCVAISVMTRMGGCLSEDTNRDGIQNDGLTPVEGIAVLLYQSPDTINPIQEVLTDENGKFLFDSLYGNTYYIQYAPPSNYKLPELVEFQGTPSIEFEDTTFIGRSFGLLSTSNGFTEKIFVPDAFEYLNYDVLLTPCIPITLDISDTTIVSGDTLIATVTGPGNYTWTPNSSLNCDTCSIVQLSPTETTTYQVTSGEECVCEGPSIMVSVFNEVGGCIREDSNGDGIDNDGSTPMENILVNLYSSGDTLNPITSIITGPNGKYHFDSLPDGKYIVEVIPAIDYSFPDIIVPLGNLSDRNGFSEEICLEDGDIELMEDALLGTCPTFKLPFNEIQITPGDTVCVQIAQAGNYVWTPNQFIDCDTCQQVKITPDSSMTFHVGRGVVNAYNCPDEDSLFITVLGKSN